MIKVSELDELAIVHITSLTLSGMLYKTICQSNKFDSIGKKKNVVYLLFVLRSEKTYFEVMISSRLRSPNYFKSFKIGNS